VKCGMSKEIDSLGVISFGNRDNQLYFLLIRLKRRE
jgi:hypothetical protein